MLFFLCYFTVQTIVRQLRPVVLQAVQRAIKANNAQQYNANNLTGRIVTELTPFVRRGVGAQIAELQQQQQANAGQIVNSVIQDLRPIIIKIIREQISPECGRRRQGLTGNDR